MTTDTHYRKLVELETRSMTLRKAAHSHYETGKAKEAEQIARDFLASRLDIERYLMTHNLTYRNFLAWYRDQPTV